MEEEMIKVELTGILREDLVIKQLAPRQDLNTGLQCPHLSRDKLPMRYRATPGEAGENFAAGLCLDR